MKVSVIIAAYNAERYLAEAIYSVANQSLSSTEYEIIAVNDGSTDNTLSILEAYRTEFSNIIVVSKENAGPSSARNVGLEMARGEYIYFLDADDILVYDALEALYNRAKEQDADMVIAGYDLFSKTSKSNIKNIVDIIKYDSIDIYEPKILWTFALWNKIFRKSIIDENNITFPPVAYSEDGVFVMKYTFMSEKITGLDKIVLHYRKQYTSIADSITASVSRKKVEDYIEAHEIIRSLIIDSFARDYPDANAENNEKFNRYYNEFLKKVVSVLITQFYTKMLSQQKECAEIICECIRKYCDEMDAYTLIKLQNNYPEIPLLDMSSDKALSKKHITAVLYGNENDSAFIPCLRSITNQNLIGFKIILPISAKECVNDAGLLFDNIEFISAESEMELFAHSLENADTDLIVFCNSKFVYATNSFKVANRRFLKDKYDFLTSIVHTEKCFVPSPVKISSLAIEEIPTGLMTNGVISLDNLLANKFFSTSFLKKINADINSDDFIELCYKKGCNHYTLNKQVTFAGSDEEFIDFLNNDIARAKYNELKATLPSLIKNESHLDEVKKQVCIICKSNALKSSGKVLKKHLKSKAVIFEINYKEEIKTPEILSAVESSAVVVSEFLLPIGNFKEEQRFILCLESGQLFDKSEFIECGEYANYNLITVSSDDLIPVLSKSLSLDESLFFATGSISADTMLGNEKQASKIIKKNKQLRNKEIILHIAGDRKINTEQIDFDSLSSALGNEQIIVTTSKLDKNYSNIVNLEKYSLSELMIISDMLITDYSDAIFNYSLLNKPIVFYCPDMNINNVGYCLHYPEDLPSHIIMTQSDLNSFISNRDKHIVTPKQMEFAKMYMSCCDGNSANRIAEIINEYTEVK